jgi:LysM repeat protein
MSVFPRLAALLIICTLMVAAPVITSQAAQAESNGPNLLVDGDFEAPPTWPQQDGIGEVQVAPGWRAWYLDQPPAYVQKPVNCNDSKTGYNCYWMRPEFRDNTSFENRIHGGIRSQKYFSYGRMHEAGLYQQVGGIKPGSLLHFAIYIQSWQCFNIDDCGKNGIRSDLPAEMHLRVGIDPTGGTNPFSPNIVWSPEQQAFDHWVEFSVEAKAQDSTVTVFTHSRADWSWARLNNDVYLDDASLVVVSGSASSGQALASPAAPKSFIYRARPLSRRLVPDADDTVWATMNAAAYKPTTVAPSAVATTAPITRTVTSPVTQSVTTTTPSGGTRTYVIIEGDTLAQIAQRFNTTVAALMQANNITDQDLIFWGMTLVIP